MENEHQGRMTAEWLANRPVQQIRPQVPRFYTTIAVVAAAASTLLSGGELLVRAHRVSETAALISVTVIALLTACRLGAKIRH